MPRVFDIQIRRDTTANWAAADIAGRVLDVGEPGYDTQLNILKIGDGVTAWGSLPGGTAPEVALQSGRYYRLPPAATLSAMTGVQFGNGTFRCMEYKFDRATTFATLGMAITVAGDAGSLADIGVYSDDGTRRPGALFYDVGAAVSNFDATIVGNQEKTVNKLFPPGRYYFGAVVTQGTATIPGVRCLQLPLQPDQVDYGTSMPADGATTTVMGFSMNGVTPGALPGTFTIAATIPANSASNDVPSIFGKVA